MESRHEMGQLLGLAAVLKDAEDPGVVVGTALPRLLVLGAAQAALVLSPGPDGPCVAFRAGADLDEAGALECGPEPGVLLTDCAVPVSWAATGTTRVCAHELPGAAGVLLLAWVGGTEPGDEGHRHGLELALLSLDAVLSRAQYAEKLTDLAARVDSAQHLASMGDYDWNIATDVNTWSDELYRIYGHEPQSFPVSYEKFLSLIHPEDRERIGAVHQQAYATGEPYQMIERIVRPDGEVRYLSSNGEVILDAESTPVRMRGTCVDITDRVLADRERERIAARFQGMVDCAPDAILVFGEDQRVLEANQRARELLGGDPQGHSIQEILPGWPSTGAADVRTTAFDGSSLRLDVTTVDVATTGPSGGQGSLVAVYLRDARTRLEREALVARLGEAQLRRRQALEINDNVVQGLVAAVYALEMGEAETSAGFLDRTLAAARAMMGDLLEPLDSAGLQPGDLVRSAAAVIGESAVVSERQA